MECVSTDIGRLLMYVLNDAIVRGMFQNLVKMANTGGMVHGLSRGKNESKPTSCIYLNNGYKKEENDIKIPDSKQSLTICFASVWDVFTRALDCKTLATPRNTPSIVISRCDLVWGSPGTVCGGNDKTGTAKINTKLNSWLNISSKKGTST